jgi:hypothetical protein
MPEMDIDETLRETYANLKGAFEGDFTPQESKAEVSEDEPQEVIEPDPAEAADPEDVAEPEAKSIEQKSEEAPAFKPPWKKAAIAEWEKLPELVRNEIKRREDDFHKGIEQYKERASASQEWERTISPYMATIQSFGVTPQQAAQQLFAADHALRVSPTPQKVQMLLKIANDYGIDLNTMAAGIQQIAGDKVWQQQNPTPPEVQQLQARIQQMEQQQQQALQQAKAQEASAIQAEIAAFAADPDHEHFPVLQKQMGVLLQSGEAKNLEEAYEMAMRANPQTYQIWFAQQQQALDAQRKAKVAAAKKSGANVVRPNGRTTVPTTQPMRSMEEDIEAKARELGLL